MRKKQQRVPRGAREGGQFPHASSDSLGQHASGLYQDAGQFPTGRCVRKTMKMPAFSQFYQIHIEFKISRQCVCVFACVCARTRAHVCVFDKKRIGTHTFTFHGKPAVAMSLTYLTISLGT